MKRNTFKSAGIAMRGSCLTVVLLGLLGEPLVHAASSPDAADRQNVLSALSLEELTKVEVSSVARKDQKLLKVAAAVYSITADEIRRSGATSVPDVLRAVPGIEVAQISSDIWAISARGFNSRYANKILVLVDGRSIYNNLYSGTFWDQNQLPLESIERIEVIRGPGATMWGANAVDGVISIITKKAKDTQGWMLSTELGQNELPQTSVRYGGKRGEALQYRLDGMFTDERPLPAANGLCGADRVNSGQTGARGDFRLSDRDTLTVDGRLYRGSGREQVNPAFPLPTSLTSVRPFRFSGGFARSDWHRKLAGSDLALEISWTRETRSEWIGRGRLDTLDADFIHHIFVGRRP